jgi:hypothetical protein
MHRHMVSIQDVWKPNSIETIEFPSIIYSLKLLLWLPQCL